MVKIHKLKLNIEFCEDVLNGVKTFEVRKNDRGFQTGDRIQFIATNGRYSVDPVTHEEKQSITHPINDKTYVITYILNGWGIKNGYVVLAIREV